MMLFSLIFIGVGTSVVVASIFRFWRFSMATAPQWNLPDPLTATHYDTRTRVLIGIMIAIMGYWVMRLDARLDTLQKQQALGAMEKNDSKVDLDQFSGRFTVLLDEIKGLNHKLDQLDEKVDLKPLPPMAASREVEQQPARTVTKQEKGRPS